MARHEKDNFDTSIHSSEEDERSLFCRERDRLIPLSFILCAAIIVGLSWFTITWIAFPEYSLDGRGDSMSPVRLEPNHVPFATSMNQTSHLANRTNLEDNVHVFSRRAGPLPCELNSPEAAPRVIYFPKTNSTSWQDVAKRIAAKDGKQCFLFDRHPREELQLKVARYFHYYVAGRQTSPNPIDMKRYVSRNGNKQTAYISLTLLTPSEEKEDDPNHSQSRAVASAKEIVRDYDFIGLAEKPELSLVVFRLLFGLEARDILYVPSALAGSITYTTVKRTCVPTGPRFVYPDVKDFMHSDEWIRANAVDLALYEETRKSLEATIDHVLGRDTFEAALAEHKRLMAAVESKCLSSVKYRCTANGHYNAHTDCNKMGCGSNCIQSILALNNTK
jgi:hypothetical protein